MISLRSPRWPADRAGVLALDTSVVFGRMYRLEHSGESVHLVSEAQSPPFTKQYDLAVDPEAIEGGDWSALAERDGHVVGLASVVMERWNRRARLEHLYVDRAARGCGVGKRLVDAAADAGRAAGMRCVWVETQTVNAPAIDFYRHLGFRWCGFDSSLYDPAAVSATEEAVFFVRPLGRIDCA